MGRLRGATQTNRTAGRALQAQIARRIVQKATAAETGIERVGANVTAAEALDALTKAHRVDAEIDELMFELIAACVLEGASTEDVRRITGIGTATLTRRLPRTLTGLRGKDLRADHAAPHGWREKDS
ncbi:hypothetical protein A5729_12575 [Mycobacterium vulneris]|nr:hypothetical protein A5729_12575 [Mycolicibacterium vulneris]